MPAQLVMLALERLTRMVCIRRRGSLAPAVLAFALSSAALAQSGSPALTAEEIVRRAVERAERQHDSLVDSEFEATVVSSVESLDADGQVTDTEAALFNQYPLQGALFDEMVEKDGRSLTEKEQRDERKRREKFITEVRKRVAQGLHPQPEEDPGVRFNSELMSRYTVELTGEEEVNGHRCWVIAFAPKPGDLPMRRRIDPALNKSTGRLWIAQDDYGIARLTFAMREPFKYWGGLLATINDTEGRLDFERVAADVWRPADFDLKLDLRILMVKSIRRHISKEWKDFRRAEAADGGSRNAPAEEARRPSSSS